jgi:hypothetical protein
MAAAAKASTVKRWLGDKGTYPVLITCVVAAGLCGFQCTRYLTGHPDVNWSKTNRMNTLKYDGEVGANWKSHRRWFATRHENAVNKAKGL